MIRMIWVQDLAGGIAKNNQIPWHIKSELHFFKQTTLNHVVVMGLKTYVTINKPLKDRINLVLTHRDLQIPGVIVCHNISEVLSYAKQHDLFIVGGKEIYKQFFIWADELIVSTVKNNYDCDLFLNFDLQDFIKTKTEVFDDFFVDYYLRKNKI